MKHSPKICENLQIICKFSWKWFSVLNNRDILCHKWFCVKYYRVVLLRFWNCHLKNSNSFNKWFMYRSFSLIRSNKWASLKALEFSFLFRISSGPISKMDAIFRRRVVHNFVRPSSILLYVFWETFSLSAMYSCERPFVTRAMRMISGGGTLTTQIFANVLINRVGKGSWQF